MNDFHATVGLVSEAFLLAPGQSLERKKDKVKNILQSMKRNNIICLKGREWIKI